MADIIAVLIPIVGFICLYGMVKVVTDNRFKRRLAEAHANADIVSSMLRADENNQRENALKWGIVSVLVGLSLVVTDIFNLNYESPAAFGLVVIATGAGLLVYYTISKSRKSLITSSFRD